MKRVFLAGLLSCLAATQFPATAHTQGANLLASQPATLTTITTAANESPAYVDQTGILVRTKVISTFLQLFDSPTDVKWNLSDHRYLASFNNNGRACKAIFNTGGSLIYSMKYGTQKDLPRNVYRLLKSAYIDYTIGVVTEVNAPQLQAWIVNLKDNDNLVVAQVVDGELEELQHYKTHF